MSTKTLTIPNEDFPSIFNDFWPWSNWPGINGSSNTTSFPAVNITEEKDNYKVSVAVPGMKKEDIHIDLEGNVLSISASKEEEHEEKKKRFTRREYSCSSFSRSFTLPEEVQKDKIEAEQHDGVLTILLPKNDEAKNSKVKQIAVR